MTKTNEFKRSARHQRIRAKITGTKERPRLVVRRSLNNLHLQLINDIESKTILTMSSASKELKSKMPQRGNIKATIQLGEIFAEAVKAKGINKIVFDRSGYQYHGRVKALAESLRKGGLDF